MNAYRKSPRTGWLIALVLCLTAAAHRAAPPAAADASVRPSAAFLSVPSTAEARPVPFCPEGEKRVCSMGPPPVCWCE